MAGIGQKHSRPPVGRGSNSAARNHPNLEAILYSSQQPLRFGYSDPVAIPLSSTSISFVHTDFRVEVGLVQAADDLLDALDRAIPIEK